MDEQKFKLKVFLWDQFIRPLKKLLNRHTLQSVLIALVILNFVTFKSAFFFWITMGVILLISIIDIVHYWKSGIYISHYRKEKYPDYRKTIKELKKQDTQLDKSVELHTANAVDESEQTGLVENNEYEKKETKEYKQGV